MAPSVLRNTVWLAVGETVGRLLRIVLIVYSARVLGAAEWGLSSYMLSWAVLFTIATDIGLGAIVTRELAKGEHDRAQYVSTFLFVKLALLAASVPVIVYLVPRLSALPVSAGLAASLAALVIFDSLRIIPSAVNKAHEAMRREAGVNVVTQATILVIGLFMTVRYGTALSLNIAYAIGSAFGTIYAFSLVRPHLPGIFTSFKGPMARRLIRDALPIAIVGLLASIMLNTDIIMLGWFRGAEEIGYYSAAQKIIFTLYALPALFASAAFPGMVRVAHNKEKLKALLESALKNALLIALPLTVGGIITAHSLISFFYGPAYVAGTAPFIVLLLTIPSVYAMAIINNALIARNEQSYFIRYAAAGIMANIALNFMLIPSLGITGVAIATLLTETVSFLYIWKVANRLIGIAIPRNMKACLMGTATATIVAGAAMASRLHVLAVIALAVAAYIGTLHAANEPALRALTGRRKKEIIAG